MGIEFGSIGSAIGSIAGSLGKAGGAVEAGAGIGAPAISLTGPAVVVGMEGGFGGIAGAASASGPQGLDTVPAFGAAPFGPGGINGFAEFGDLGQFQAIGLDAFGPEARALSKPVSNDVLGSISFLKDSVPVYTRSSDPMAEAAVAEAEAIIAEAWKHPVLEQNPLNEAEVLAEENHWAGVAEKQALLLPLSTEEANVPLNRENEAEAELRINPFAVPLGTQYPNPNPAEVVTSVPQPIFAPLVNTATDRGLSAGVKNENDAGQAVFIRTAPKAEAQALEETVEEKVETEKIIDREEEEEEEEIRENLKLLKDEEASYVRKVEISEAVLKASEEAGMLGLNKVEGWRVGKHMPQEHAGNRSRVVKEAGPDGSYEETVEAVISAGEFDFPYKAVQKLTSIVDEKKPVKFGKKGQEVGEEHLARVLKYRIVRYAQKPAEVVSKRIIKKKMAVIVSGREPVVIRQDAPVKPKEPTINDYPALAGVFPKAA